MTPPVPPDLRLGYPVFEVRRPSRRTGFCHAMLGLRAPLSNPHGSLGDSLNNEQAQHPVARSFSGGARRKRAAAPGDRP